MMKFRFLAVLFAVCLLLCQSCSRSHDNIVENTPAQQAVTAGSWQITLFTDSGKDETKNFSGYNFQFGNNGALTATKNNTSKKGTWSLNSGSNKFKIDLGPKANNNKPLGELTDEWKIISISQSEIKLSDDNAASKEFLTFTKN